MLDSLLPIVCTSADEGFAYLRREIPDVEKAQAVAALNQAAATLELLTGRKLAFRTYRTQVTGLTATSVANSAALSSVSSTANVKAGDYAFGANLRPGSQVVSVDSASALTLNVAATAAGAFTLSVGTEPEIRDGESVLEWTGDAWPMYADERPIVEVFAVKEIKTDGTTESLDLTGMRLHKPSGAIWLYAERAPKGTFNVELHYSAGLRFPSSSVAGDSEEIFAAQLATHRLAQANFQDWAGAVGRASDSSLGSSSRRVNSFDVPEDVDRIVQLLRRR